MQQLIRAVKNPFRLFITQLQVHLVHTLKKKNKQQTIGHEIHWFNQRVEKRTSKERWRLNLNNSAGFFTDVAFVPLNSDCVLLFLLIFSMLIPCRRFTCCAPLFILKIRVNISLGHTWVRLGNCRSQFCKYLVLSFLYRCSRIATATALALHCSKFCFTSFVAICFIFCASLLLQNSFPKSYTIMHTIWSQIN